MQNHTRLLTTASIAFFSALLCCNLASAQNTTPTEALPDPSWSLSKPRLSPKKNTNLSLLSPTAPDDSTHSKDSNDNSTQESSPTPTKDAGRRRRVIKNGAYLLYFYEYDPFDDESFLHVLGLYWRRTNPDWSLNVLVPFGGTWSWKKDPERWGFITPLVWHVAEPDFNYTGAWLYHSWTSDTSNFSTVFPIYWHIEDPQKRDSLHIFANTYVRTRPEGNDWGFLPLAWGSSGEDRTALTVLPLFAYNEHPKGSSFVSLFYTHSRDEESTFSSIPLLLTFWSEDQETTSIYNPLFTLTLNPKRNTTSGSIPLLLAGWEKRNATENREASLETYQFPLWYSRTTDTESFYWFTPTLTFEYSDEDGSVSGIFPIYFDYFEDDEHFFTTFLPLLYFNTSDGPDESFTMLGPAFRYREDEETALGLFPLFLSHKNTRTDNGLTVLLPLYYALDDYGISQRVFLPLLYGSFIDEDEDTALHIAGPYYNYREGNAHAYGLAPFFFHTDDEDLGTSFNLIPGLWYSDHTPDSKTDHWGPLYRHTSETEFALGLFPLGLYRQDAEEETKELFLAPFMYFSDGPDDQYASVVGPAWSTRDGDETSHGLAPFFAYETWADGGHLLWLPGFLDVAWHDEDSELRDWHLTWFLTGLRFGSRQGTSITAVAPLFLSVEDNQDKTEWTFALPWIFTWADHRADSRTVFAPPFYYDREGEDTFWVAAPLALGYEDSDVDWWAIAPLILDIHDKTDGTQYIFGPGLFGRISKGDTAVLGTDRAESAPETFDIGWVGPFVWADNNDRTLRLLAPLFINYDNRAEGDAFTALLPLWMRWKDTTERLTVRSLDAFFPLYVRYTEEDEKGNLLDSRTAIGPVFGYDTETSSGFGFAPIFWHDRTQSEQGESGHDIVFPVVWSFFDEAEDMSLKVVGPLYSYTDRDTSSYGIAPLHFGHHERDIMAGTHEGWSTTLPFYWHSYTDGPNTEDSSWRLVTPIGFHDEQGDAYRGLWLNRWYSVSEHHETDVFFPLYWHQRDVLGHFTSILPVYFEGSSPTGEWALVPPFYYRSKNALEESETLWAFPYFGWHDRTSTFDAVPPIFFQSRNDKGDLFRLVAPLFLQLHDSQTHTRFTALGPIWHHGTDTGAYDTGFFPFFWWGRGADIDEMNNDLDWYAFLAPILWLSQDEDSFVSILGPTWFHNHDGGHSGGLIPLAFWQRDDVQDVTRNGVFPLYYYMNSPEENSFYSLLYMHNRTETQRLHIGPFFFHASDDITGDSTTVAGPLVWNEDLEGENFHLLPLYFDRRNKDGSSWRLALPFYYGERGVHGDTLDVILPLGMHSASADGRETLLIAGPYVDAHDGDDWAGGVVPLYFGGRDGDGSSWNTVLGLYWDWEDTQTEAKGTILGPAYTTQDENGDKEAGLFPIAGYSDTKEDGLSAWLLPIAGYNRSADGQETTVVAGPMFYNEDRTEDRTDFGVMPLIWGHAQGDTTSHTVLPAYHYEGRADGHTFMSPVAYSHRESDVWRAWSLLYAGWGDQRGSNHVLFPLFYSASNRDGSSLDILLPLYARWKRPGNQSGGSVFFPIYWDFYNTQDQSTATVLFPLYWHFNSPDRELRIVGPWFMSERRDRGRRSHGLVPLYYYSEDPTGYTFNVLGGLFGVDHAYQTKESEYQLLWIPF